MPIIVLIGLLVLAMALWAAWWLWRRRRWARLFGQALAPERAELLECCVPLYRRLPAALRARLHGLVNLFIDGADFVGCGGLTVDDEIRLTVAGNACVLLLGGSKQRFPGVRTILVYPDSFVSRQTSYDGFVEIREDSVRAGESWHRGPVVLAWSDIRASRVAPWGGHNVVLHEFAHKLDEENAGMDGLPVLRDKAQYAEWAQVLGREYESLRASAKVGAESVLDPYGAVSPAEFFAVATEAFFENSATLKLDLPELYDQLRRFYNLDPAEWRAERG